MAHSLSKTVRFSTQASQKQWMFPRGAAEIDASDQVIMPGLIDTHSHIEGVSGGDGSVPHPAKNQELLSGTESDASAGSGWPTRRKRTGSRIRTFTGLSKRRPGTNRVSRSARTAEESHSGCSD